jgi:hypothetical protein
VLTDGESNIKSLIAEVKKAGDLGIRVSFGFLAAPNSFFQPDLLQAILKTGGAYMSFDQAENIQPWLFLLLSNGLTASDQAASTEQPLLSGITIAKLSGGNPVAFSYAAQAAEQLVFTVESLSKQGLGAELQGADGGAISKNSTIKGPLTLSYTSAGTGTLKLIVSPLNSTTEGVFQVSLNSSLGISGCNLNTTRPTNNTGSGTGSGTGTGTGSGSGSGTGSGSGSGYGNPTLTPTGGPKPTKPPVFDGAAGRLSATGFSLVGFFFAAFFL